MSKKNKKKNKKNKVRSVFGYSDKREEKHAKPSKKDRKILKKGRSIKPTLSKKEAKKVRKFAQEYPEVTPKIADIRAKCNHANDVISIEEYTQYPNHYNPTLDLMVDAFGPNDVSICADCFEPLLDKSIVNESNLRAAVATIVGTINYITPRVKMSEEELAKHSAKKAKLMKLLNVLLEELQDAYKHDEDVARADELQQHMGERRAQMRKNNNSEKTYKPSQVVNLGSGNNGFVRDDDDSDEE